MCAATLRLLLELLELLFDKFNAVATAHSIVLNHLQQIVVSPSGAQEGIKLYEQADVSAKIQTVLQVSELFMVLFVYSFIFQSHSKNPHSSPLHLFELVLIIQSRAPNY